MTHSHHDIDLNIAVSQALDFRFKQVSGGITIYPLNLKVAECPHKIEDNKMYNKKKLIE